MMIVAMVKLMVEKMGLHATSPADQQGGRGTRAVLQLAIAPTGPAIPCDTATRDGGRCLGSSSAGAAHSACRGRGGRCPGGGSRSRREDAPLPARPPARGALARMRARGPAVPLAWPASRPLLAGARRAAVRSRSRLRPRLQLQQLLRRLCRDRRHAAERLGQRRHECRGVREEWVAVDGGLCKLPQAHGLPEHEAAHEQVRALLLAHVLEQRLRRRRGGEVCVWGGGGIGQGGRGYRAARGQAGI